MPRQRDSDATLEALEVAVAASSAASTRWQSLTAEQLAPLVDWVCAPRWSRSRRGRVRDAVALLERPPLSEGQLGIADVMFPIGRVGPLDHL
jgi:hypothetical protein